MAMQNLGVACKTEHVAISLVEIKLKFKKWQFEDFISSLVIILIKAYPAIPLSSQYNLGQRYI
jgi:hypothetical protein